MFGYVFFMFHMTWIRTNMLLDKNKQRARFYTLPFICLFSLDTFFKGGISFPSLEIIQIILEIQSEVSWLLCKLIKRFILLLGIDFFL